MNKKEYEFTCEGCGKKYKLLLADFEYKAGYYRKHCSRKCANRRIHSPETKQKISNSIKTQWEKANAEIIARRNDEAMSIYLSRERSIEEATEAQQYQANNCPIQFCKVCGNVVPFNKIHIRQTCSKECKLFLLREAGKINGKKSAAVQVRRSKNEIAFANLCINHLKNCIITTNEPFFDGWDADIIIKDYKIAILWNGVWHYRQVRAKQSLKQIQSRDTIKIEKIKSFGYEPYIIQDLGRKFA